MTTRLTPLLKRLAARLPNGAQHELLVERARALVRRLGWQRRYCGHPLAALLVGPAGGGLGRALPSDLTN